MSIAILELIEIAPYFEIESTPVLVRRSHGPLSHMFNKTVSTLRYGLSFDGAYSVEDYSEHLSDLKCRVQQYKGGEPVLAGRKFSQPAHVVYCDYSEDIKLKDRVVYNGDTYVVVFLFAEGNADLYLKFVMERVE